MKITWKHVTVLAAVAASSLGVLCSPPPPIDCRGGIDIESNPDDAWVASAPSGVVVDVALIDTEFDEERVGSLDTDAEDPGLRELLQDPSARCRTIVHRPRAGGRLVRRRGLGASSRHPSRRRIDASTLRGERYSSPLVPLSQVCNRRS